MNELYRKRLLADGRTLGSSRKKISDIIMNATWDNDIQSKSCYIYDYFHDDEHDKQGALSPDHSHTKCRIDAKFIITQYSTLSKDQVEYHIMFRPGQQNPLKYFNSDYCDKYNSEFPIGMYIDIPNDEGIYNRWLICSKEIGNQFIKYSVLPCNYKFQWVFNGNKYEMWGIARLRNSYNSGQWTDYKTTTVENQDSAWLPLNIYSQNLYYNQRLIVSHKIYNPSREIFPITWSISKVEGLHPIGIQKVILYQDKFNKDTDYIELNENGNIVGMWADYKSSSIIPTALDADTKYTAKINYSGYTNQLRVCGGYKKLTCSFYDNLGNQIEKEIGKWHFAINGESFDEFVTILYNPEEPSSIKIKFVNKQGFNAEQYIGCVLDISVSSKDDKCNASTQFELVSL